MAIKNSFKSLPSGLELELLYGQVNWFTILVADILPIISVAVTSGGSPLFASGSGDNHARIWNYSTM